MQFICSSYAVLTTSYTTRAANQPVAKFYEEAAPPRHGGHRQTTCSHACEPSGLRAPKPFCIESLVDHRLGLGTGQCCLPRDRISRASRNAKTATSF